MQYYYEPESGIKFRSLIAVERYLAEVDEDAPLSKTLEGIMKNKPLSQAFKVENIKVSSIFIFDIFDSDFSLPFVDRTQSILVSGLLSAILEGRKMLPEKNHKLPLLSSHQ